MKCLLIALGLLMVGCDHPDGWEYESRLPANSTTKDLMETESMLYSNGYKRVRIKYSPYYLDYVIQATKTKSEEGGAK